MAMLFYIKMPEKTQLNGCVVTFNSYSFMHLHKRYFTILLLALALALPCGYNIAMAAEDAQNAEEASEDDNGDALSDSGLPIPRFVSLKFEEVNMRSGPGRRYPIRWVYKRKNMPVEVVEEFGHWRKLRDVEGDEGWAHKSQLSGTRMAIFKADTILRRYPEASAPPMIKAQKNVIAQLLECDVNWCEVQVESYKSWVEKGAIWGVYAREVL
jgi:SH3-like domain-containing protein